MCVTSFYHLHDDDGDLCQRPRHARVWPLDFEIERSHEGNGQSFQRPRHARVWPLDFEIERSVVRVNSVLRNISNIDSPTQSVSD